MATAHLSVKVGKVGKGTPHAEYISREGKYAERLNQGEKLEATESGNMPKWAEHDPIEFWKAADQYERKNGYVYREHEIALPRELNAEQRAQLVREWVEQELGDRHAYTWAIHNKTALDGGEQPHVHLMFSERINDGIERDPEQYFKRYNAKYPERGGAKKHSEQGTQTQRKEALQALRSRWERLHNAHLSIHGHRGRIDMRSLVEQGESRRAERKMTPSESAALQRQAAASRLVRAELEKLTTAELTAKHKNAIEAVKTGGVSLHIEERDKLAAELANRQLELEAATQQAQANSKTAKQMQAEITAIEGDPNTWSGALKSLLPTSKQGKARIADIMQEYRHLKAADDKLQERIAELKSGIAKLHEGIGHHERQIESGDKRQYERLSEYAVELDEILSSRPGVKALRIYQEKAANLSPENKKLLAFYERNFKELLQGLPKEKQPVALENFCLNIAEKMHGSHLDLPKPEYRQQEQGREYGQSREHDDYEMDR